MTDGIAPAAQQGVLSTQLEQALRQVVAAPPPQQVTPPPAPPADSGRGASVDVVA